MGGKNDVISRGRSSVSHFALCLGLLLPALATLASPASAQNLVVNGDFAINGGDGSNGTALAWTTINFGYETCTAAGNCGSFPALGAPPGVGAYALITPNIGGGAAQDVTLARSGHYQFSFYHVVAPFGPPNPSLNVTVGGQTVFNGVDNATSWTLLTAKLTLAAGVNAIDFTDTYHGSNEGFIGDVILTFLGPNAISPSLPQGAPVNAVNVAGGIDKFLANNGTLPAGLLGVAALSGQPLVNALMQLDGQTSTQAENGAFQLMNQFMALMLDPFADGRYGGGASNFAPDREASLPPDIAMAYASVMKAPPMQQNDRWSVWGTGFGGVNHSNGDPNAGSANVTANTYGFASGADYHFNRDTLVGFALAGSGTNWGLAQSLGNGRSDAFQAGVYGKTAWGPVYLAADLAYTENWFTTNRIALGDQLSAKFNGESFGGRLESGYRYILPSTAGRFEITPYGAIQAQSFRTPSYSETDFANAGLGLNFNSMNATDTRSELGARFADTTALNDMPLIVRARLAWAHDWVDNPALNATFQALPGSGFTVNGAPIPSDSALVSVGGELHMTTHWSALAKFDGEFSGNSQTYAGTGTLRYTW
jgi:uncharacterized protein YhjY with autotransporter beta-barrel domain